MSEPFKVGELVVTELTGDIVEVTDIRSLNRGIFTGIVVKHISSDEFNTVHYNIGFKSNAWWAPAFRRYPSVLRFTKLKIL